MKPFLLFVIYINIVKLPISISMKNTCLIDSMLIRNRLPEFGPNLIATLTCLEMDNFPRHDTL